MQTILTLFLAFLLAFTTSDSLSGLRDSIARRQDRLVSSEDVLQPGGDLPALAPAAEARQDAVSWDDMVYEHCDDEAFNKDLAQFSALAAGTDGQALLALYDDLYGQLVHADTMAELAYIHFSADVTDGYWSDESVYSDNLCAGMEDGFLTACHEALEGPCASQLTDHVGQDMADLFIGYVPLTAREEELLARETELSDEYYERINAADQVEYTYLGQSWTLDMINGFQGTNLAYQDYDGYLEVLMGLQRAIAEQVGPIYQQLVRLRAELAQLEGYESYTDLAYEQTCLRDYTGEDAQALCDAVKPIARAYYRDLYYADMWDETDSISPPLDADGLLQALRLGAEKLDPALADVWEGMTAGGLIDVDYGEDRVASNYTDYLSEYGRPFIFMSMAGDYYDLTTLAHEFGHFTRLYLYPPANMLLGDGCLDLMEIHSTGLEALFTFCYDDIYDQGADAARFAVLCDLVGAVIEGCVYDEFQRAVYAQPDMDTEDFSRLLADIRAQYGVYEPTEEDYNWMYVPHNFDTPLYYISYAVSALAAIQIWDEAQMDLPSGVGLWEQVMSHDAYTEQYLDVLESCGLRLFTQEGAVEEICAPLMEELTRLSAGQ